MKTSEKILKLKQDISSITSSPLIESIDVSKIQQFESDSNYEDKIKLIEECLSKSDYLHSDNHKNIYSAYNEMIVYEIIEKKLTIEFEREVKGIKTPDYKISKNEYCCYADLKTLNFSDGNNNYIDIQEQSTESKIKLEKEVSKREKAVIFGEPVIVSPFKKGNNLNHYNLNVIIEEIIKKAKQNYKEEQVNYKGTKGIFIIDLSQMLIPTDLNEAIPVKRGVLYKELNSGILWNAVFCQLGDPSYNWIEFEGKPNVGERFNLNGILNDPLNFNNLSAVIFVVSNSSETKLIGFHKSNLEDENVLEILYTICDYVNDDLNSKGYAV